MILPGYYFTRSAPTESDPMGSDPGVPATGGRVRVDILDRDVFDGTLTVSAPWGTSYGVTEGTGVGEVSTVSGLSVLDVQLGLQVVRDALAKSGPAPRLAARAVVAGLTQDGIRQVAGDLVSAIRSTPDDTLKALAVLALGFVLRDGAG